MLARGSRLDALTAAGDVQVATSGRAAAVPETFMLSLCRNSGIRAGAWQTAVCADCWGRQAAGLRPTPVPAATCPGAPGPAPCGEDPPRWETALVCLRYTCVVCRVRPWGWNCVCLCGAEQGLEVSGWSGHSRSRSDSQNVQRHRTDGLVDAWPGLPRGGAFPPRRGPRAAAEETQPRRLPRRASQ